MRTSLWSMLVAGLVLVAGRVCPAQEAAGSYKPLLVVSFAGYDEARTGLQALGKIAGQADLAKMLEGMIQKNAGEALSGLDKTRPWGAVFQANGQEQRMEDTRNFGFVPVTNLKKLLALVPEPLRPQAPGPDGIYEMKSRGPGKGSYIMEKGGWAFIADNKETLKAVPADPSALLGDLPKRYVVGARVSVKNLPPALRKQLLGGVEQMMKLNTRRMPPEAAAIYAARMKKSMDQVVAVINDLDELLAGWAVDASKQATYLDVEMTAQPGTKTARQLASMQNAKTQFAGFLIPGAAATATMTRALDESEVAELKGELTAFAARITKEVDRNENLPKEQAQLAKKMIADVADVLHKTLEAKKIDGGMAVLANPEAITAAAGWTIAEGAKLQGVVKQLIDETKKEQPKLPEAFGLKPDEYQGIKFHTISIPIEDEDAARMLGRQLPVVLGIGEDKLYLGAGRDAMKTIKAAIDASKEAKPVPPFQFSLAATPIVRLFAATEGPMQPMGRQLLNVLGQTPGKDHLNVTVKAIPNGQTCRVELEQGLIKTIGMAVQMAFMMREAMPGPGGGGPGGDPFGR